MLNRKRDAFRRVFEPGLTPTRRAFYRIFHRPDSDLVLYDLWRWCHYNSTTHVPGDTHGSAQLEGRRQVFLRILNMARIDERHLMRAVASGQQREAQE